MIRNWQFIVTHKDIQQHFATHYDAIPEEALLGLYERANHDCFELNVLSGVNVHSR